VLVVRWVLCILDLGVVLGVLYNYLSDEYRGTGVLCLVNYQSART